MEGVVGRKIRCVWRVWPLICGFLLVSAGSLAAQSNITVDRVLAEPNLTYGSAAYLALVAAQEISPDSSPREAFDTLRRLGPEPSDRIRAGDEIALGAYAHILMERLGFRGGLLYRIAPGPRYAARWLQRTRIVEPPALPGMRLSGARALRILERAARYREGERLW